MSRSEDDVIFSATILREEAKMAAVRRFDGADEASYRALRILIVEDDADTSDSIAFLLNHWGFETIPARSGPEALLAAEVRAPDIVLLDIAMPGMDGLEVAVRLREKAPSNVKRLFIIALSGYGDAQIRQRASVPGQK